MLGGVAILVFIAVVVVARQRRRQKYLSMQLFESEEALLRSEETAQEFRKAWEIMWDELEDIDRSSIGVGAAGEVFRCKWRGIPVAVKVLHAHRMELADTEEMDKEASMLRTVRHAHIVQFYGAGVRPPEHIPFIVTELMELGSLTQVLEQTELPWAVKYRFAFEIATGMKLVHSLGRMHRDLKSGNILVTSVSGVMRVKVADFGTATLLGDGIAKADWRDTRAAAYKANATLAGSSDAGAAGAGASSANSSSTVKFAGSTATASLRSNLLDDSTAGESVVYGSVNEHASNISEATLPSAGGSSGVGTSSEHTNLSIPSASSAPRSSYSRTFTKMIGTPLWMAPEVLAIDKYGPSADVYSYAMVMWEIAAQAIPWHDTEYGGLGFADELLKQIRRGDRPPIQEHWPAPFVRIMQWAWSLDPITRPRFAEIVDLLKTASDEYAQNGSASASGGHSVQMESLK